MKKKEHYFALSVSALAVSAMAASFFVHTPTVHALAEPTMSASNYSVSGFIDSPWSGLGGGFTSSGAKVSVAGADTAGSDAWSRYAQLPGTKDSFYSDAYTLEGGNKVSIEFSINLKDTGNQSQNGTDLDVVLFDAQTDAQLARLRIWCDSGGWENGSHSCETYFSDWTKYSAAQWIKGDAKSSSSFTIVFSKESLFESYVGGSEELTRIDTADNAYLAAKTEAIENASKVYFRIQGDNGFNTQADVVLRSINGQSLALDDSNRFTDMKAPTFVEGAAVEKKLTAGTPYEIPTTAYDELSAVTYSVVYNGETVSGKSFTPVMGVSTATLRAQDEAGNVSEKEYTFEIVSNIAAPTITAVPEIANQDIPVFSSVSFDMPTYTDDSGSATVSLAMTYLDAEEPQAVSLPLKEGKFTQYFDATAKNGRYQFVYTVSNSGGSVSGDPIVANFTFTRPSPIGWLEEPSNMVAAYVDSGIEISTTTNWNYIDLGQFDLDEGFDIKFVVPNDGANVAVDNGAIDLRLVSIDNPDIAIIYRVWCQTSGNDCPCNVYLINGEHTDDLTDCGWINANVDEVSRQFHMGWRKDEGLVGERLGGIQKAYPEKAESQAIYDSFMAALPSHHFNATFSASKWGVTDDSHSMLRAIVTSINGQSFANADGKISEVKDAVLEAKLSQNEVALGEEASYSVYAKDIFTRSFADLPIAATITAPDGTTSEKTIHSLDTETIKAEQVGEYKIALSVTGTNGKEIKKELTFIAKSATTPVTLEVEGEYLSTYDVGDSLTILPASYSENAVVKTITVTKPSGEGVEVKAGDSFLLSAPGIYFIRYYAADDAVPAPNEQEKVFTINVLDRENPIISAEIPETAKVGDTLSTIIIVKDASETSVKTTIASPNGDKEVLEGTTLSYTFKAEGTYTISIKATDAYENSATAEYQVVVSKAKKASKGCGGSVVGGAFVGAASFLAAGILILHGRKKRKE